MSRFYACEKALEITTAAPLDGSASQAPAGQLLLAVVDGSGVAFADSPYRVDHAPLDCGKEMSCGFGMIASQYAFDFKSASGTDSPLRVYMGETVPWTSGGTTFTVHNLRSYDTGQCDDYRNWAYTIYVDPK